MKKSNISGWKDVFSFTFLQTMKSKAYLVSLVILLILAAVSMPFISLITSNGVIDTSGESPIKKVYINNKTDLTNMDFSALKSEAAFKNISFETIQQEGYDALAKKIEDSEKTSVILTIKNDMGVYSLDFVKASKSPVKDESLSFLGDAIAAEFKNIKLNSLGVSGEQSTLLHAEVTTKVSQLNADGTVIVKEDTSISGSEYWIMYGIIFVVMMVNIMASTQIATSIVTEKSTRVIEYLLTSVKPLALMVGKIIAMLSAVLIQILSLVVVIFLSNKVSAAITGNEKDVLSTYLPSNIFENLNVFNVLVCIIVVILGMIFYAILAGLAGATVSKLEEIQEGLQLFTIVNLVGAYIGIAAANILMGSGDNGFVTFSFLFPLSSPFILPGAILIGKANAIMVLTAVVLLVIFIVLLFNFVAKVFETLILHNGSTIKLKQLTKLTKV